MYILQNKSINERSGIVANQESDRAAKYLENNTDCGKSFFLHRSKNNEKEVHKIVICFDSLKLLGLDVIGRESMSGTGN